MKTLVTGGVRSGKSTHAESLLSATDPVRYVALGPTPVAEDDDDWRARVDRHRASRSPHWETVETADLPHALGLAATHPLLVDCLGTWLARFMDDRHLWDVAVSEVESAFAEETTRVVEALRAATADVVVVTNEVGLGVVPEHRSGRLFRDLLGTLNQAVAATCDEVHLVVAGRVLVI
ncbi:MAG: bifunctional adenosylcobinamide kinase/adenosylcobinamide-phosphate guanylyltransferase [Nocardioides sp.]|nr:bifunctional adenosylcobinamide kinase/adenosylcobinamide-phosphate guanylyltransferase [Nocardioides sp.]